MELKIIENNIKNHLEKLAKFTKTPDNGITRLAFSEEAKKTADYLYREMDKLKLETKEDNAANVTGRLNAENNDKPCIIIGSHYDSVQNGGNFDGIAGIVCGLEIVRLIKENNIKMKYPLEITGLNDEEGARFGNGFLGSKAILGLVDTGELHQYKDKDGITISQAITDYGLNPDMVNSDSKSPEDIKCFIEIHPEQGRILEINNKELGIVDNIVGMQRYIIEIDGRADHAGTTPMDIRIDSMEIASKIISKIPDMARAEKNGSVATVGYIENYPNAVNIIPEKTVFTVDIRSKNNNSVEKIAGQIKNELKTTCKKYSTQFKITQKLNEKAVRLNETLNNKIENIIKSKNYTYQHIDSGAGHDSLCFAKHVDTTMLFVPSKNGRSHTKEEWTDYEYLAKAVNVVYNLVLEMNIF